MSVCCDFCVLSFRRLSPGLFTCSEVFYGSLSVDSFLCCQVEVCAMGISQVQISTMDVCML